MSMSICLACKQQLSPEMKSDLNEGIEGWEKVVLLTFPCADITVVTNTQLGP